MIARSGPWQTRTVTQWTLIVPVKGTALAKSRLGGSNGALARAIALDTVDAAVGASGVAQVIVVTTADAASDFVDLGARVVIDTASGLVAAIELGLAEAARDAGTAVLLGDVPGLRPDELAAALEAATAHPRSFVADADETGTVLVTARPGVRHELRFGAGSRDGHAAAGYVELRGDWPGLRRDVDLPEHLRSDLLGRRTRDALGS